MLGRSRNSLFLLFVPARDLLLPSLTLGEVRRSPPSVAALPNLKIRKGQRRRTSRIAPQTLAPSSKVTHASARVRVDVKSQSAAKGMGRKDKNAQMGVKTMALTDGWTMGPPALNEPWNRSVSPQSTHVRPLLNVRQLQKHSTADKKGECPYLERPYLMPHAHRLCRTRHRRRAPRNPGNGAGSNCFT